MQLEAEVMKSAEQLQGVDFTGESIISSMDRNSETMHINFDYYSRNRCYKSYQCKEKISDSFSRIIWNLYEKYPEVNSIAILYNAMGKYRTIYSSNECLSCRTFFR